MERPPSIDAPGSGPSDLEDAARAPDDIDLVAKRLGPPATWRFRIPMQEGEFALLDRTGADGRWQDATILIDARRLPDPPVYDTLGIPQVHGRAGSFVAIRKRWYPEGLYRYPSGTAAPGEGIVHTALCGSARETGLEVRLVRYLLATDGEFYLGDADDPRRTRPWRSHVFLAEPMTDTVSPEGHAAVEARVVGGDEMLGTIHPRLLGHGLGGFHYRVGLQERALGLIGIGAGRVPDVPDAA